MQVIGCQGAAKSNRRRLRTKPDGDQHIDGDGLAIESRGLVSPLAKGIESSLSEGCGAGDDLHVRDMSGLVDLSVDDDITRDMSLLGDSGIGRHNARDELGLLDFAAHANRCFGRRGRRSKG